MYIKTITVNELNDILQKHFRSRNIYILKVVLADLKHQHDPNTFDVGIGGQCSITFESTRKLK